MDRLILFGGALTDLFPNQFLADLEKIWVLRSVIPDPKNPGSCFSLHSIV